MNKITLTLVFALIAVPVVVLAGPRDQLRGWKAEKRLQSLVESDADNAKAADPLFDDVLNTLGAEMLRPKAGDCVFSGPDDALRCEAPVGFVAGSQLSSMLYRLRTSLYTGQAATESICFEAPWGRAQPLVLDKPGASAFLALAELDEAKLAPQRFSLGKIGNRLVTLSPKLLGEGLYKEVRRQADAGKGSITFRMSPFPEKTPVELKLRTSRGEELIFPVELNGARQEVKINKNARWSLTGTTKRFKYQGGKATQQLLLGALLQAGKVTISNIASEDYFSRLYPKLKGASNHELHLLGSSKSWFGKAAFTVKPRARVYRTSGACDLVVEFSSTGDKKVRSGPLPLADWEKITGTRVIDLSRETTQTAYLLRAPVRAGAEQLSPEEFDELLKRPALCSRRCSEAAASSGALTVRDIEGEIVKEFRKLDFDANTCVQACLVKSEYADCLDERVLSRNGADRKRSGLGYCEARR
jgi:hypothetical protein